MQRPAGAAGNPTILLLAGPGNAGAIIAVDGPMGNSGPGRSVG